MQIMDGHIYILNLFNMKSKLLLILTLLILQGKYLYSQCLSIELSITWETGYDIFRRDSVIAIPKLNITYRNNCDTNYYFLNLSEREVNLPIMGCMQTSRPTDGEIMHPDFFKDNELFGKNTNQNFSVMVAEGAPSYGSDCWHISDCNFTDDYAEGVRDEYMKLFFCARVNCDLESIYKYIRLTNNSQEDKVLVSKESKKTKFKFVEEDLLPENILGYLKDQFLFLKAGETHTDSYNLIAFKIVEGCFTFFIKQKDIKSYVETSESLPKDKDWVMPPSGKVHGNYVYYELELPELVGEYFRYVGGFNTNKVTVCFGEK